VLYVQMHNDVSVYHENIHILVVDDDVNIATVFRQCLIADEETVFDVSCRSSAYSHAAGVFDIV